MIKGEVYLTLTTSYKFDCEGKNYDELINDAIRQIPEGITYEDLEYEIGDTEGEEEDE